MSMFDNVWFKIGAMLFGVILDIFMQWEYAEGRQAGKRGIEEFKKWSASKKAKQNYSAYWAWCFAKAFFLFSFYLAYIFVWAMPSAIGFFAAEVSHKAEIRQKANTIYQAKQARLNQISGTLAALNAQLNTEAGTGYGRNSREVAERIDKLSEEQKNLLESLENLPEVSENVSGTFAALEKVYGIPSGKLIMYLFGACVAMLYLGMVLTSGAWDRKEANQPVEAPAPVAVTVEEPKEEPKPEPTQEQKELVKFVEALFDTTRKNLNGDARVSERTGIPPERCAYYRDYLSRFTIRGKPAIDKRQGVSLPNYSKDTVIKHILGGAA